MTTEEQAAQEAEEKAKAQAAAAAAQEKAKIEEPPHPVPDDPKLLRAEMERARKEAAKYRVQAREAAEAKRKAEEASLTEKGQFKELAESRAKEIEALKSELEPLRSTAATYQQREAEELTKRAAQVAADFAALPEDARAEVPDDADLRTKEIAVRMYQRAVGQAKPKPPTVQPTTPRPAGTPSAGLLSPDEEARCAQTIGNPRASAKEKAEARAKLTAHNAASQGR